MVLAGLTRSPRPTRSSSRCCSSTPSPSCCCSALIGRELWRVLQARRRGRAASRLHVRIVALFSVIAAVPAILVAVVASVTLDRGLDRLFSQQNRSR